MWHSEIPYNNLCLIADFLKMQERKKVNGKRGISFGLHKCTFGDYTH